MSYNLYQGKHFLKDAPNSVWSLTKIDHLGNKVCFVHCRVAQPLAERLDFLSEKLGDREVSTMKVWHHYGKCAFCGKDENDNTATGRTN